jgi:hypothetical protein
MTSDVARAGGALTAGCSACRDVRQRLYVSLARGDAAQLAFVDRGHA